MFQNMFLSLFLCFLWCQMPVRILASRVAVIGAGFGGASVVFHANQAGQVSQLDVYEKTSRVGGRVMTIDFAGRKFEAGGSIIHSKNKYAVDLAKKLGLTHRNDDNEVDFSDLGLMGIYDGKEFVFTESSNQLITLLKIIRRYGLDPLKIQVMIESMIDNFGNIYLYQKKGVSFNSVFDLLSSMSHKFPDATKHSFRQYLQHFRLNNETINELIGSIALVNYGQNVDQLHGFVGSVSTSGADFAGSLWSVNGGNEQIPQRMMNVSGAKLLTDNEVKEITRLGTTFQVTDVNGNQQAYDAVVIAHPLPLSDLRFTNFDEVTMERINKEKKRGQYHQTVATFIAGRRSGNISLPGIDEVIVSDPSSTFQSISKQRPVQSYSRHTCSQCKFDVYKVFSRNPLTQDEISFLFDEVNEIKVIPWKAYPDYKQLDSSPTFLLSPGLFYVNAIEWAASAMEMSLVGGKNVALLLRDYLFKETRSHG